MDDLIDIADITRDDIERVYDLTDGMKTDVREHHDALQQQTLLMLFAKPSTRTRVSFETGMTQLGGHAINFSVEQSQMSRGESLKDTAHVLSRYVDVIMARVYDHDDILALQEYADVPVINGLTDRLHPCQALADCYTMQEHGLAFDDAHVTYVGDGNNVAHSLIQTCAALGIDVTFSGPQGYEPDADILDRARDVAADTGSEIRVVHDPHEAVRDADVIYTDVWVSMGDTDDEERLRRLQHYQVDAELVNTAGNPFVMHPLPAHRGQEITGDVLDSDNSIVYDQAENRLHVQKAVLLEVLDAV